MRFGRHSARVVDFTQRTDQGILLLFYSVVNHCERVENQPAVF